MSLDLNLHRKTMFDIINVIYSSDISSFLGFKGGTLCMFVYGLDRFSVDLDFDLVGKNQDLSAVKEKLKQIISKFGTIKEEKRSKLILKYKEDGYPLKIEINDRVKENDKHEIVNFLGKSILAMTKDCIFANKLVALKERKERKDIVASRDLYDIWFFFKNNFPINEKLLLERTNQNLLDYLTGLKIFIQDNFNQKNVLVGLGDLVNEKQKYFIKNNLIKEVLSQIDFFIWNKTH